MKNLLYVAVATTMASLFVVMFWAQVGGVATAFARSKTGTHTVTYSPPIQSLQPVY